MRYGQDLQGNNSAFSYRSWLISDKKLLDDVYLLK